MANTKISALTANTNPTGLEELVYAYNNANGKMTLNTMKSFVGGAGITTLNADANIWELSEGTYVTAYDLYYKSGEAVPSFESTGRTLKQMIFVIQEAGGEKGFLVFNVGSKNSIFTPMISFGYSYSSSDGECERMASREWTFRMYRPSNQTGSIDSIGGADMVQKVTNMTGSDTLRISGTSAPYSGVTYTIYVESASSAYTIGLGTGVTNPLGITLPTSTTKKCIITVLITSSTTGIVSGCTIEP